MEEISIEKLRVGDNMAFEAMFKTYYANIERFINYYINDLSESEDLAQGVFVSLWQRRAALQSSGNVKQLLFSMAKHAAIDALRRRKVRDEYRNRPTVSETLKIEMLDRFDTERMEGRISNAMKALQESDRNIFEKSHIKNMTYNQIAAELNISEKTVEKRIYIARKILREQLKDDYYMILFF